jgi:hypothetical protein
MKSYHDERSEVPPLSAEEELYRQQDPGVRALDQLVQQLESAISSTKKDPAFQGLPGWPAIDREFRRTKRLQRSLQGIQLQLGLCGPGQVYRGRLKLSELEVREAFEGLQALVLTFIPQKSDYPEHQPVIEPIKAGDRVRERRSLRAMTVEKIEDGTAHCMWRDRWGNPYRDTFPVGLLVMAEAFAGRRETS